jgi:hypothetical protein
MAIWGIELITPKNWYRRRREGGYQPDPLPAGKTISPPPGRPGTYPNPPPVPEIREAHELAKNLLEASKRAEQAWSKAQLVDAMQSVRFWTNEIEKVISKSS